MKGNSNNNSNNNILQFAGAERAMLLCVIRALQAQHSGRILHVKYVNYMLNT